MVVSMGPWQAAAATVMAVSGAACSINQLGAVHVDAVNGDKAQVFSLTAPGLHIDTLSSEPSLTLGLFQVSHVFSEDCLEHSGDLARAFENSVPELTQMRAFGVHIVTATGEFGITIGAREKTLLLYQPVNSSRARQLSFVSSEPEKTSLFLGADHESCQQRKG